MKMRTVVLLILAGIMLTSCLGAYSPLPITGELIAPPGSEVYAVHIGSTVNGIKAALAGRSGTYILQRKDVIMFGWSIKDAWAFATVSAKSGSPIKNFAHVAKTGNLVNCKTFTELVSLLKYNGWKAIPASAVPVGLKTAVASSTVAELMRWAGNTMTSFLVVPVGAVTPPDELMNQEVLQ